MDEFLDIAVDGAGQVHVVMEDTGATNDILYERSTDGGLTFSAPLNIANTANDSFVPAIAASGASVAVVWHDIIGTGLSAQGEVQFVSSNNAGTSFSAPQNLSGSSVNSISADVAANGGFHVVWAEGGAAVYRRSSDGIGFMPAVQLGTVAPGGSLHNPRIAVSGPDVGVVWTTSDLSFNVQGPFFRRSADGGGSFNLPQDLSAGLTGTRVVTVALSAGSPVKVVWPHASSGLFVDTDVLLRREVVPFAGGPFDGGGQSDEVDSFLTYTSPFESRTMLPVGTTSFSVKIIYSPTIIPSTLEASLNGAAFGGFTAIPGATQTVSVPLAPGRNVLVLKVRGLTASGRNAGDQDRLTFIVD